MLLLLEKEATVRKKTLSKGEIIALAIAAEEAEDLEQFKQVVRQLEGVPKTGRLIYNLARGQVADARIEYGRRSRAYRDWLVNYIVRYCSEGLSK